MSDIAVGLAVPPFTAASTQGEISLDSLRGHCAVLYFYPKDSTPGCTTEAQGFRDRYQDFIDAGCQIVGISRDSLKSHASFAEKQNLPFPLIADPDETMCQLFGVMKMKNMYGKQVRGVERSTFLLDGQGVLIREWRGLRVAGHVDEVLQAVQEQA
ncbi:peroxiredoxin [Pollutimonas bauzanensis]|uniref:thioredoxin-dependent peroxiredoxin n=1 Tax=Pollutimonas bauzanensis TaxID=658167 RepID=A0A1M5ZR93_9BURK|nr:peroxiredoxin [Pollutimonas bauzanensis]SHI26473.1 peroxiredoxin Q/BCP [Pollutimonas bauzanensis]